MSGSAAASATISLPGVRVGVEVGVEVRFLLGVRVRTAAGLEAGFDQECELSFHQHTAYNPTRP